MKFCKISISILLMAFCLTISVGAQQSTSEVLEIGNGQVAEIENGKTTHLYTEKEGAIQEGDASTKALVKSGDVDWVLHRQSPDSEVCNLYAHYYGPSASYLKFNKLDIGGYNLWDATKYGTIPGRTIGFNGSYVNYYCFIAEVYVPINVSKVAIRQYGLQVYQIPSGVWTVPGMGGSYINVDPYW